MEQTNLSAMKAYLIYHHNGDIYHRHANELLDDLHDTLSHALVAFEETGQAKYLLAPKMEQYRNSVAIEDHERPSYTVTGILPILDTVMPLRFSAHRYYSADVLSPYKELHNKVSGRWNEWLSTCTIG